MSGSADLHVDLLLSILQNRALKDGFLPKISERLPPDVTSFTWSKVSRSRTFLQLANNGIMVMAVYTVSTSSSHSVRPAVALLNMNLRETS